MRATPTARDFFLANIYRSGLFTCIFPKPLPSFSCAGCGKTGTAWARKIKIGYPAHHYRQLMQIPVLSARGIQIGSKTCVIFSLGLRSKIGDKIWVVVWEKETFFWCNEATSETLMYKLVTQLNNVTQSISLNKFICSSATMPPETDPLYRQVIAYSDSFSVSFI